MEVNQAFCDLSLNIAERAAVKASLIEIKLNENFKHTKFWGKIFGIERDYLIIEATQITHQIESKYFFSVDNGLSFSQLPIVEPWMHEKCLQIATTFTGTVSHIYKDKKSKKRRKNGDGDGDEDDADEDEEEANNNDDEEDDSKENESKNNAGDEPPAIINRLTELDRLAWTIAKIKEECFIVCKNAKILTSKKLIADNPYFAGLNKSEANNLSSYMHWRTPQNPYSISKYRKASAMNDTDFMDAITNDLPNGCWRLRSLKSGLEIKVRNLLWPGFEFQYAVGDQIAGGVQAYYGHGIRQNDLVFLI